MSITAEITFLPLAYFENKFIPFTEAKLSIATELPLSVVYEVLPTLAIRDRYYYLD
jgi:hypothetical protein